MDLHLAECIDELKERFSIDKDTFKNKIAIS